MTSKTKKKSPKLPKKLFKTEKAKSQFLIDWEAEMHFWHEIFTIYNFSNRKDLADRVFSQYIRLKHSDNRGYCYCVTCWDRVFRKDAQNWHYRTRSCLKYRFDERNCHPQCYKCNVLLSGNYRNYHIYMVKTYWEKVEEELRNDKTTFKISQWAYENDILYWYKNIIKMKNHKSLEKY